MNNRSDQPVDKSNLPLSAPSELDVETLERNRRIIPVERRISWLGWLVAIAILVANKKIGIALIIVLLVFRQFPTLNLKNLPGKFGSIWRKMRS